jgi:membrane-bound serine protease (ClpP class)
MPLALPIVLTIVGLAFVVAEVFFVSMGLLSLIAGTLFLAADILAYQESAVAGWAFIVSQVIFVPLIVHFAFKALPHTRFGRRMVLTGPVTQPTGGLPDHEHLEGSEGRALTALRPAGTADIGGERVSVVAIGGMIEKGARLVVESVEGPEVRVRSLGPAQDDADDS